MYLCLVNCSTSLVLPLERLKKKKENKFGKQVCMANIYQDPKTFFTSTQIHMVCFVFIILYSFSWRYPHAMFSQISATRTVESRNKISINAVNLLPRIHSINLHKVSHFTIICVLLVTYIAYYLLRLNRTEQNNLLTLLLRQEQDVHYNMTCILLCIYILQPKKAMKIHI